MKLILLGLTFVSIFAYLYLYTIYKDKPRSNGLKLIGILILFSLTIKLLHAPAFIVGIPYIFGTIGFVPLIKPAFKDTFTNDFAFLEGVSLSILTASFLVNLVLLFVQV